MIYTSTAGEEKLFPLYFLQPSAKAQNAGEAGDTPRLEQIFKTISFSSARSDAQIAGSVTAGWGDEGAHPETFWLGYAASAAAAWHPATPQPAEIASSFYSLFYGPNVVATDAVYRLMSSQALVWENTWDTVNSTARKGIFGSSNAIYEPRRPAKDQGPALAALSLRTACLREPMGSRKCRPPSTCPESYAFEPNPDGCVAWESSPGGPKSL